MYIHKHTQKYTYLRSGRITAVGQYVHSIRMTSLQSPAIRLALEKDIHDFYSVAKPLINHPKPMTSYVMDLAWVKPSPKSDTDGTSRHKILLVEVNPFDGFYGTMSGSTGLFSWQSDRQLLTGKQAKAKASVASDAKTCTVPKFVLRLREEELPSEEVKRRTRPEWWSLMNTLA